jgi:hypothetical protein
MPAVSVPIIDQLVHPSFGLLTRTATLGTFTGAGTLTPPQNPLVALTYGLSWSFFTIPARFGLTLGDPVLYEQRILQLASEYQDLGGHSFLAQVANINADGLFYLWDEPLPAAIHYFIAPGCAINFFWLQT